MVHAPSVAPCEVLADIPALQGGGRTHRVVAGGIEILMVHAKKEWIGSFPLVSERLDFPDRLG
jgi:hypothetical protein